jgi:Ca-activated chloride channel homolog
MYGSGNIEIANGVDRGSARRRGTSQMRRAVLCCALVALTVGACSSSAATSAPYNQPPDQHHYSTAAPTMAWSYTQPPVYQTTAPQVPYPPVIFPSLGTNPYVSTQSDHLSTFGLDVDTASYTVARGYIANGVRPDPASVRPEEWVNYFDQGYRTPETGTFAIYGDGGPTPFLSSGEVLLRVGVKAADASSRDPSAVALTFVIDVSGSMADGNRLDLVKQALSMLTDQLRDQDRVSIVAFSDDAQMVLAPTSGADKERILDAIATLRPENATNTEAGLRLGYELERRQFIQGGINRVVLATDGVANVGTTDATTILDEIGADSSSGIQLVAVGVGMGNYNDALLEQLADKGQGYYAYVDSPAEAKRIFVDELAKTIDTVALDGKAQIDFNPETVAGYRLIGYEDRGIPDGSFRDPNATGGAIGAGHQVTALYALVLRPGEGFDQRLATVSLRWTDPASRQTQEIAQDINRGDLAPNFAVTDPHFKLDSIVAATAETLRNSPWIPGYSVSDLRGAANELAGLLPDTADARDFLKLIDQLGSMYR